MNRRKSKFNPWVSYSDLFSALILMFALITILFVSSIKNFEEIVGKKKEILDKLEAAFKEKNISIDIDKKTGAIKISNDILFAFDSDVLTDRGKEEIKKTVVETYLSVLFSDKYIDSISSVIIEGHADPKGDDYYNLVLSFRRALSVYNYIKSLKDIIPENSDKLDKILKCVGRGEIDLIYNIQNLIDYDKSRRVEVKFELKDIEELEKLLNQIKSKNKDSNKDENK